MSGVVERLEAEVRRLKEENAQLSMLLDQARIEGEKTQAEMKILKEENERLNNALVWKPRRKPSGRTS